ncbi:MAG: class I SAM-dependent methyltransferase [Candidatus Woesebacteria bacterium]|nr:class I SAM-dependent methyltransferase [Candidatus Woesebacteria bacterium]
MKATDKKYTKNIHYYLDFVPKTLAQLVKIQAFKFLLDLGCGDGAILFALKQRGLLKNKKVFAIDISKERIFKAQKIDKNFRCLVMDACKLNKIIPAKSVNLVISSQVIEHIPDPKEFIKQIKQVLKTGGFLYLSTVFKKWYGWYFYKSEEGKWVLDPTHLREYRKEKELLPLFKKAGFRLIHNEKILWRFPVTDFFLKRLGLSNDIYYRYPLLRKFRLLKVPILGYYYWELVFKKEIK